MSIDIRPVYVCRCGEVNEDALAAITVRDERIAFMQEDIANLERELRSKRAMIGRLKSEQDRNLKNDHHYEDAMDVLRHWKTECSPSARELSGKRLESCIARLRGRYTVADLKRAVDGYALKPYVTQRGRSHEGHKDEWRADAELIFRDAKHVDEGIRIADRADDLRSVMAQPSLTVVQSTPPAGTYGQQVRPLGTLSELGEAALRLASKGFMVFPCQVRGKAPATPNGLLDAKRDPVAISKFWSAHPHHNIGVRTGAESGIVVLDVDGDEGWENLHRLEDQYGDLPTTASVTTPSGGQHFYFRHPGFEIRNTTGFPAEKLDIRGDGGYVIAPPSIGSGGRSYEVDEQTAIVAMPDWLLYVLRTRQAQTAGNLSEARDWAKEARELKSQGQRNNHMTSYVGHLFRHNHDADEVFSLARLLNQNYRPPLTESEISKVVASIARAEARKAA